jgi:hypothetical protein
MGALTPAEQTQLQGLLRRVENHLETLVLGAELLDEG